MLVKPEVSELCLEDTRLVLEAASVVSARGGGTSRRHDQYW